MQRGKAGGLSGGMMMGWSGLWGELWGGLLGFGGVGVCCSHFFCIFVVAFYGMNKNDTRCYLIKSTI